MNSPSCSCDFNDKGIDYYGVLSLKSNCTDLDIKAAFRRLATRYDPQMQKDGSNLAVFSLIAEAYDVLSDPLKKAVYDQYGEYGLKKGVEGPDEFIEPYIFHGDPMKTYRQFFGTERTYSNLLDAHHKFPEGEVQKDKEEPLYLSLVEVFFGGIKKMSIRRTIVVGDDKSTVVSQEKILTVPIKPGIPTGTRIVFPQEGDEKPGRSPADVIFITRDRPHETFRRDGSDLYMTVDIFLREALTGTVVTVNTVDERTLRIPITSIVTPNYKKVVYGEGLPLPGNPSEKGNLIINFNVEFPSYLPSDNKNYVKKAFQEPTTIQDAEGTEYIHRFILGGKMRKNIDANVPLRRDMKDEDAEAIRKMCNM